MGRSDREQEANESASDPLLPLLERLARPPRAALPRGARLGRYEIVALIGRGGMGEVYRARDARLGRDVALKILGGDDTSPAVHELFDIESRAVGRLNHPNVVVAFDAGEDQGLRYLVSEYLEGETLARRLRRGALPPDEAAHVALAIAQALQALHGAGVVHRDLKPANVFITRDGRVKVLDFGLARFVAEPDPGAGGLLGTRGYMAPEQLRGLPAETRSDIFSFGAMLHEMLSGSCPFEKGARAETAHGILDEAPPSLPREVPPALAHVVTRCLAENPEHRFSSASELIQALAPVARPRLRRWTRAALLGAAAVVVALAVLLGRTARHLPAEEPRSVAVLPFVNANGDPQDDYLSEGVTEELTSALASIGGLRVAARSSASSFKGKSVSVRKIGEDLRVSAVVRGDVRRDGKRVRLFTELVRTADGDRVWSNRFEGDQADLVSLEQEVTRSIARALLPTFDSQAPTPARRTTSNPAAYDAYLKGRYFSGRYTRGDIPRAIAFYQQAIAADPAWALPYACLGHAEIAMLSEEQRPSAAQLPRAEKAISKALELDPDLAEAHASLGDLKWHQFDWHGAEREYRRAIELNRGDGEYRGSYAMILGYRGRTLEARAEMERRLRFDPIGLSTNAGSAVLRMFAREYDQAILEAKRLLVMAPESGVARSVLQVAYAQTGRYAEALALIDPHSDEDVAFRAYVLAISGRQGAARRDLALLEGRAKHVYVPASAIALVHAGIGDRDAAFAWLEKAYAEGDYRLRHLKAPYWDSLRSDPRFGKVLEKVHLQ